MNIQFFLKWTKSFIILLLLQNLHISQASELSDHYQCTSAEPHQLKIITSGAIALRTYIQAIESAKESIELESFVLDPDPATQLILFALYKKAKEGISIRILLDSYGSQKNIQNAPIWFSALQQAGIQFRFYNSAFFEPFPINHRKFLFIDHKFVFSGGRNLSSENFQVNDEKNRIDYSYILNGPIIKCAVETFEKYWVSELTTIAEAANESTNLNLTLPSKSLEIQYKLASLSQQDLPIFNISNLTFISDHPDSEHRFFVDFLTEKISSTQSQLIIETPQFFVDQKIGDSLINLLNLKIPIHIYTLSEATDYFSKENLLYSMLANNPHKIEEIKELGANVDFYNGYYIEAEPILNNNLKNTKWGSHCKLVIFDEDKILLSSYNFDIVSELKNREAGFYFENAKPVVDFFLKIQSQRKYKNEAN